MKKLQDILTNIPTIKIIGNTNIEINELQLDSRLIATNDVYIAIKGVAVDGHQFINQTIEKGAVALVVEELPESIVENITYIQVEDARKTTALLATNYYNNPSTKLQLVGVTGTNGKTTIASLLFELYKNCSYKVGLLSTIENKINDSIIPSTHTTPNPIVLNQLLAQMVEANCTHCFMEVSSHAADQDRIAGLQFKGALFTNISHDHLDYHKDFNHYIAAKKKFFDQLPTNTFAIVNADDKRGLVMLQNTNAKKLTVAIKSEADYKFKILENTFLGLVLKYKQYDIHAHLVGRFNAYNLLLIFATCVELGMEEQDALSQISKLKTAEGRFDTMRSANGIIGIVDYAHTPDALKNVLDTINEIRTGNEQVICVVGCGGNRDKTKRPEMALIASQLSAKSIFTADNPRNEDADTIIEEMRKGVLPQNFNKVLAITNRKEAIRTAVNLANPNDIILVAGKGHEKYQEINGVKHPFDDKAILQSAFNEFNK